jgi:hypothetical protein
MRKPVRIGIGGAVGSGKTALLVALCREMSRAYSLAAITNDIFTREDAEFVVPSGALSPDRVMGVEIGGCPHTAIREDVSMNSHAIEEMIERHPGLDGIKNKRDPGKRLDIDMYTQGHTVTNARRLPLNLLDALREFDESAVLREGLGDEFSSAYLKLKYDEWNKYSRHLTEWEREPTLDC